MNNSAVDGLIQSGKALAAYQSEVLSEGNEKLTAFTGRTVKVSFVSMTVIVILAFGVAVFIALLITRPILLVDDEAAKIASGDLTGEKINIKSKDEIGSLAESFNTMLTYLKEMVGDLQEKSRTVAASAAEISASIENVSAGAGETASTVNEVASTVERVSDNVQNIAGASGQAASFAKNGSEDLKKVVDQMRIIQRGAVSAGEVVRSLGEAGA